MHGDEIFQYLQNYKVHDFDQGHSRKLLQSSTSYIQIENTKTTRLLFKGGWILPYFWHSNWYYFGNISGKVANPHFLESPQESLKTCQNSNQRGRPLRNKGPLKIWKTYVFWQLIFQKTNCWHLEFSMNQIFGQRFIIFEKLRYMGQLRAVEVATSVHWISSRST